jgi:hypothetical protein
MRAERTLECDLKTEVDFVPRGADFEMRLENRSRLCAAWSGLGNATLETEVDFRMPRGADFELRLKKSTLDCHVKGTFRCDCSSRFCATRGGLKMQKTKSTFRKAKAKKQRKRVVLPPERA